MVFEAALAPVVTPETEDTMSKIATQINMDFGPMVQHGVDGQKYIREFDDSKSGDLGLAPHNVTQRFNMLHNTCRDRVGIFTCNIPKCLSYY